MALPATENFASANDPLANSSNWADHGATTGNGRAASGLYKYATVPSFVDQSGYWSADTFDDDQYSQITISIDANNNSYRLGVIVRGGAGNEAILLRFRMGSANRDLEAYRWLSGGSRVALDGNPHTPSDTVAAGDIIKAEVIGTTLTAYIDYGAGFISEGTWDIDTGDASNGPTSGSAGLYIVDDDSPADNISGDDWEGGDITPPPPGGPAVYPRRHIGFFYG